MSEPHVAADDAVVADARVSTENGGAGVDGDVILDVRVTLVGESAREVAAGFAAADRIERTQRDAMIERNVLADGGGFADDHAGAMIDEEGFADGGAGMDVDSGTAVGDFRHDARE